MQVLLYVDFFEELAILFVVLLLHVLFIALCIRIKHLFILAVGHLIDRFIIHSDQLRES